MNQRRYLLTLIDAGIALAAYLCTALLFQSNIVSMGLHGTFDLVKYGLILGCIFCFRYFLRIYNTLWRYASVSTYLKLVAADICAGVCFWTLGRIYYPFNLGFAASVIVFMVNLILTLCSRFVYQVQYARRGQRKDGTASGNKIQIAVVGAGNVGASLAEELIRNPKSHYIPVCFFDTDTTKVGNAINGVPIYQENEHTADFIKNQLPIQEIVIAIPDAPQEEKICSRHMRPTGCPLWEKISTRWSAWSARRSAAATPSP